MNGFETSNPFFKGCTFYQFIRDDAYILNMFRYTFGFNILLFKIRR